MADMVRNQHVATLWWGDGPGPMHSARTEKNCPHQIATHKTKGPIARFHEATFKNAELRFSRSHRDAFLPERRSR